MTESSDRIDACTHVTLDVYAHVRAALAEDFRLHAILELEGVEAAAWTAADLAWKKRLASDAKGFARFEEELILAEDWLDRDVAPLREEVAAWTAFLDAYLSSPSPFDFVNGLGLRMSDVGRLQRRWALRMEADRAIEKQAAELRRRPLVLPAIRVAESTLKRSRNAKPVAAVPVTAAPALAASAPALREVRGVDLNQFAAIRAEIRQNPGSIGATLRRHGLANEDDYREIERAFDEHFTIAPDVERDYHRLIAHHDGRLRIAGTSLNLDVPRGPALPFVAPGTALALDVPRGPATPFHAPEPEALGFNLVRYAELVAVQGEQGADRADALSKFGIDAAAHEQIDAYWQRQFSLNGLLALEFGRMLVQAQRALAERRTRRDAAPVGTGTALTLDVPRAPSPPADPPVPLPPPLRLPLPDLTLDQYAWLTATLRRTAPADLPTVLARVRLTPELRRGLENRWSGRMAGDPRLKETFIALLARHLGAPGGEAG